MTAMFGDEALLALARAVVGISTRAADQIGEVSVVQLRALTILREMKVANLAQLAEGMGVTVSTTSRLVDRLVSAGFVDRQRAAHSRREIALRLTAAGQSTLDRYDQLRLADMRACLDRLPTDERSVVLDAFAAFAAVSPWASEPPMPAPAEA